MASAIAGSPRARSVHVTPSQWQPSYKHPSSKYSTGARCLCIIGREGKAYIKRASEDIFNDDGLSSQK